MTQKTLAAITVVAAAITLAACGGSDTSGLNPGLAGSWSGNSILGSDSTLIAQWPATVTVTVSGQNGAMTPICPGGSGTITASGTGNTANWTGTLQCPPFELGSCATAVLTWTTARATLSADGTSLLSYASGQLSGCSQNTPVYLNFVGHK